MLVNRFVVFCVGKSIISINAYPGIIYILATLKKVKKMKFWKINQV